MIFYDLHIHTTASDGAFSPSEIVEKAVKRGLKGIAITDHDAIEGIEEAVVYASHHYPGFLVIPGIEMNTTADGESVHILGYGIDYHNKNFICSLQKMRGWREERALKIVEKLSTLGYSITYDEVAALADGSIGRPHIARVLVNKKMIPSVQWAFDHLLSKGKKAYVPRHEFSPVQAVELIHHYGGVAILAHPGLINNQKEVRHLLDAIPPIIDGLEVHYPAHKLYQVEKYKEWANERNLLITGGSDYHGIGNNEHGGYVGFRGLDKEKFIEFSSKVAKIKKDWIF